MKRENDLLQRLLDFSIRIIKMLREFDNSIENRVIKSQLIKSSSSSGANYEESLGAISKADFINKVRISLKEMRETNYWLKVLKGIQSGKNDNSELLKLLDESEQLKKILGSICINSTRKS
jgi:four helix bundle protein